MGLVLVVLCLRVTGAAACGSAPRIDLFVLPFGLFCTDSFKCILATRTYCCPCEKQINKQSIRVSTCSIIHVAGFLTLICVCWVLYRQWQRTKAPEQGSASFIRENTTNCSNVFLSCDKSCVLVCTITPYAADSCVVVTDFLFFIGLNI